MESKLSVSPTKFAIVNQRSFLPLAILSLLALWVTGLQAQLYTDETAFLAAVGPGYYFNSLAGTADSTVSFSGGSAPFGYDVSSPNDVYNGPSFIGTDEPDNPFTFTFTNTLPTAVGGNFFATDIDDGFVPNTTIILTYSDGFVDNYIPASATQFRGYISSLALTSLIVTLSAPVDDLAYVSINDVTVGTAIPEPTTLGLIALGALLLGRRRVSRA